MTVDECIAKADADLDVALRERWDHLLLQMLQDGCSIEGAAVILEEQQALDREWKRQQLVTICEQLITAFTPRK